MKKADIIKTIQQHEAELFLQMKEYEQKFGEGSNLHKSSRAEWCGVHSLMEKLNIEADTSLPEFDKAVKIISEMKMVKQFEEDDFAGRDVLPY